MSRNQQFRFSRRGAVGVTMALIVGVLFGLLAFGLDAGYIYAKRGDLQKSADIAALAGGRALVAFPDDLSEVASVAVNYGRGNLGGDDMPSNALTTTDVSFFLDGSPDLVHPNQVEVTIGRTQARGNPLELFFAAVLGVDETEVVATARVEAQQVCSSECVKPFSVPDLFSWDDVDGDGELDTDVPAELDSVEVIGYDRAYNHGDRVTLKIGNPQETVSPGHFFAIDLPPVNRATPVTGASEYELNIASCEGSNQYLVSVGDELQLEPGNMVGPTKKGIEDLVAQDPNAYWDDAGREVADSDFYPELSSPRVVVIAFYDPRQPPVSGRNSIFVINMAAMFIEGVDSSGNVSGIYMETVAYNPNPEPGNCGLYQLRFVRDSSR